jgi:peptide/nickel transport system substrate-binding protein
MINKVEPLVATDRTAAEQLYKEMQVRILGTAPILFLYNSNYQYAMQNNFTGLQVNPAYPNVVFVYDLKPTGS